ncbi:hypothetical protein Bca101_062975 [Brassica carinata]
MVRTTVLKVDDHAIEGPMLALLSYSQSDLFRDIPFNRILYGFSLILFFSGVFDDDEENMRLMKALTERKYETCDCFVYVDLLLNAYCCFVTTTEQSWRGPEVSCRNIGSTYRWFKFRTCSFPRPTLVSWRRSEQAKTNWDSLCINELSCKNGVLMARKLLLEPQKLQCTQYTPPPKEYAEELQKALLIE